MGLLDRVIDRIWQYGWDNGFLEQLKESQLRRDYRQGEHKYQLLVHPGQHNSNIRMNFTGLVIDRSVTLLFGEGVEFDLPGEEETPEDEYIQAIWEANKRGILLRKLGILGAEQGTCYLKIMPNGMTGKDGNTYPRLIVVDPALVQMDTLPDDMEIVYRYTIQYRANDMQGNEQAYRQLIEAGNFVEAEIERADGETVLVIRQADVVEDAPNNWRVVDQIMDKGGKWQTVGEQIWEYDFPPILHWQNLPEPTNVYGAPDITPDIIELQDQINYAYSNINEIIRLYANPLRVGIGFTTAPEPTTGPNKMLLIPNPDGRIDQLQPLGDLIAARQFAETLRQALFDITQTVDISSMADKLGQLTNFGLKVLYTDAISKLNTKRELYGDALTELNRRLLVIGGFANTDPGEVIWPEILPEDEQAAMQADQFDLEAGLASKQTIAERRGYNWEVEQERMTDERATGDNIGALLLQNFNRGTVQ
jgi:hypothetical protein